MAYSAQYEGGLNTIRVALPLGEGAVTGGSHLVAHMPKRGRIVRVTYGGAAPVTGTALTAHMVAREEDGQGPGEMLQDVATDIAFASTTDAYRGVDAVLVSGSEQARLDVHARQVLILTITASAITAGPGNLIVEINFEPR